MTENALTKRDAPLSDDDIQMIKRQVCPDHTPDTEFEMFIRQCNRTGLDPLHKQIYLLKVGGKFHIMTSIDGARLTAHRSGQYEGQVGPMWCGDDGEWSEVWPKSRGNPTAAKVGVLRKGAREPTWGVAHWDEYQGTGPVWKNKPRLMLAKCAEALALRKAFPQELSSLYTREEMEQAVDEEPRNVTPEKERPKQQPKAEPKKAEPVVIETKAEPVDEERDTVIRKKIAESCERIKLSDEEVNAIYMMYGGDASKVMEFLRGVAVKEGSDHGRIKKAIVTALEKGGQ